MWDCGSRGKLDFSCVSDSVTRGWPRWICVFVFMICFFVLASLNLYNIYILPAKRGVWDNHPNCLI